MKKNVVFLPFLLALVLLLSKGLPDLAAQESVDPTAEAIAPLLKKETFLLVHIDLLRLDAKSFTGPTEGQDVPGNAKFQSFLALLKEANVEDVCILSAIETMQLFPMFFAIRGEPNFSEEMTELMTQLGISKAGVLGDFTLCVPPTSNLFTTLGLPSAPTAPVTQEVASQQFMRLMSSLKTAKRPEIDAALKMQQKSPVRVIIAPAATLKAILNVTIPMMAAKQPLPKNIDVKDIQTLLRDLESLSLGIDPAAKRYNLACQFPSEEKAENADAIIRKIATSWQAESADMKYRQFVDDLLPKLRKNRLILVIQPSLFEKHKAYLPGASALVSPSMLPIPAMPSGATK